MPRNFDTTPYSEAEVRVAAWFAKHGIGGGDDPIGAIIASNESLAHELNKLRSIISDKKIDAEKGA